MRILALQAKLFWEAPEKNLAHFTDLLQSVEAGTDLIVLPEMFTTGFSMNPQVKSPQQAQATALWLQEQALKHQALIMGSCIWPEQGQYSNRLLCFGPQGSQGYYDKRHLFNLAGEGQVYQAGQNRLMIEHQNWRICPLICYDLRFPVWSRNRQPYYDLLVYVANWPDRRISHWQSLLRARAIENQAYVLGVNRVGSDASGLEHSGYSALIDPLGQTVFELDQGQETLAYAQLDRGLLVQTREKLPFLRDADDFELRP